MQQNSLEEILRAKMAVPVNIKGKEGATVMPMEAIAMAIMNNAMRGDLAAANFIRQLTGSSLPRARPNWSCWPWSSPRSVASPPCSWPRVTPTSW